MQPPFARGNEAMLRRVPKGVPIVHARIFDHILKERCDAPITLDGNGIPRTSAKDSVSDPWLNLAHDGPIYPFRIGVALCLGCGREFTGNKFSESIAPIWSLFEPFTV
jgi:hypothetical protein